MNVTLQTWEMTDTLTDALQIPHHNKKGLQIYGGPGSLSHEFKIWPITFQGSGTGQ